MSNKLNADILFCEQFPRSNKYDPAWVFENEMGPNPLWLTEFLVQPFDLKPGMRVLDLGCGKGITSVFLAREFGVQVYAVDFDQWGTTPDDRWIHAKKYGVEHLVIPVKADARNLPFAQGFFDVIVCVDAYFYFGHEETYLENVIKFLRPGGQIGMVVPGYMKDITNGVPDYMKEEFDDGSCTWQTLPWWKNLWEKTGLVSINTADTLTDGWTFWVRNDEAYHEYYEKNKASRETEIIKQDKGEYIGFIRLVATKN